MDNLKIDLKTNLKIDTADLKIDLKIDMADLKTNLTNFLQEILTNGEKVVKETHDVNKINANHDFIDSNVGSKTHHIPKN